MFVPLTPRDPAIKTDPNINMADKTKNTIHKLMTVYIIQSGIAGKRARLVLTMDSNEEYDENQY